MTAALVAVLVAGIGVPLAVWWSGRRGASTRDADRQLRQRYGLTAGEAIEVERTALAGRRAAEPRLRPAVAAWAHYRLAGEGAAARLRARVVSVIALAAVVAYLVVDLTVGRRARVHAPLLLLAILLNCVQLAVGPAGTTARLRRAVDRNRETGGEA